MRGCSFHSPDTVKRSIEFMSQNPEIPVAETNPPGQPSTLTFAYFLVVASVSLLAWFGGSMLVKIVLGPDGPGWLENVLSAAMGAIGFLLGTHLVTRLRDK